MSNHKVIGIDLAKRVLQVCVVDSRANRVIENKPIKVGQLMKYMLHHKPCTVAMEACGSAHYWARRLRELGHEVMLIAPQFVAPFRKGHKTDANDAFAIAECARRPDIRTVPVKNVEQQNLQALHRARELLVKQKTQLTNQLHGLLLEYGIVSNQGHTAVVTSVLLAIEDAENELSDPVREMLQPIRNTIIIKAAN